MLAVKTEREGSNSLLTLRKSRTASKNSVRLSCSCCPTCGRVVEHAAKAMVWIGNKQENASTASNVDASIVSSAFRNCESAISWWLDALIKYLIESWVDLR